MNIRNNLWNSYACASPFTYKFSAYETKLRKDETKNSTNYATHNKKTAVWSKWKRRTGMMHKKSCTVRTVYSTHFFCFNYRYYYLSSVSKHRMTCHAVLIGFHNRMLNSISSRISSCYFAIKNGYQLECKIGTFQWWFQTSHTWQAQQIIADFRMWKHNKHTNAAFH